MEYIQIFSKKFLSQISWKMFFVRFRYDEHTVLHTNPPVEVLWVQVYMVADLTQVAIQKKTTVLPQSRWEKCQTDGRKLCDRDILFSAGLTRHSVLIWNQLVVQTLLISFNYWKNFLNYIIGFFLGGCHEKLTVTSRSMEKRPRFYTSLYILGAWGEVAGFKYEWKVQGKCILTHY